MIALTLAEITAAVDGTLVGGDPGLTVTGSVEVDSREAGPGGLFVAFAGDRADGHEFAGAALHAGAVAVLGTRPIDGPSIVVGDALTAMAALARAVLDRRPDLPVIGITGSSGKTSTKDIIAQVLAGLGPTVATVGSLNNELGLPQTVTRITDQTRFLVLEMGARGLGDLDYLCRVAAPTVGVVTNVGVAHIGEFGSVDVIAQAKTELVAALPPSGLAVLNADDDRVRAMAAQTPAEVVLVGESVDAVVRAEDIRLDEHGRPAFDLVTPEGRVGVVLRLSGRHQVGNALAAAAVARAYGMSVSSIGAALADLRPVSTRRMDVVDRVDGVTLIDDSYNANPDSTAVALRVLASFGPTRRRVAVLGYHAELGSYEQTGHERIGRLAAELGVHRLVVVGVGAAPIHDGAMSVSEWGGESVRVTDQEAAVSLLRAELRPGDVVLVKGSRYQTWAVADALRVGGDVGVPVDSTVAAS